MTEERTPVRSHSTDFELDEDPISEGGMWLNGKTDAIDWADVVTKDGRCFGARSKNSVLEKRAQQGNLDDEADDAIGDYDDPTAILSGEWGPNQYGRAEVFADNPTEDVFQEAQIRLRCEVGANHLRGYEVFFRTLKSENSYAEIVRWNGAIGDWTSLAREVGPEFGVETGDVIEASMEGNLIKGFINGELKITVEDDKYSDGAPGVGFNFGTGDTHTDHGLLNFHVDTYE